MADHIRIGDIAPRVLYSGDGATTAFTYPFPVFDDGDLQVHVDGVMQTLSTDYTVTGAGTSSGGSVTFTTAPVSGASVSLVRRLTVKRTADFQASGEFRASVINDELDFLTAAVQQVEEDLSRSVRLNEYDTSASLTLPDADARATRLLGFDGSGDIEMLLPNSDTYIALSTFAETLIDDADAATARATLGLEIGTDVQAHLDVPSQAEAEAGAATTARVWTAERVAQAIAAQAADEDTVARDMAASALAYAMAANDASSITGSVGKFYLSDDFESDGLAVSTNATYDAGGDYYTSETAGYSSDQVPTMTGNSAPSGAVSASGETSYAAWKAFDDAGASTGWETSFPGTAWIAYQFAAARTISRYKLTSFINSNDRPPRDWTFQGSNNGSDWDTLDTQSGISWSTSETKTYDVSSPASYTYCRLHITDNNGNPSVNVAEFEMLEDATPANMTLAPSAATLDTADPADLLAYVVIDPRESITPGTDIAMTMSIDGGTTDAAGTWTKVGDIGSTGEELYRVEADVSGQSGSSLIYEITTADNKAIRYHDCVGLVAIY